MLITAENILEDYRNRLLQHEPRQPRRRDSRNPGVPYPGGAADSAHHLQALPSHGYAAVPQRGGFLVSFAGETQWNWTIDPRGRFYVTVDFDNESVALASIRLAERVINALDSKDIAQIDMNRE